MDNMKNIQTFLENLWQTLTIWDLIDVALVAFLIYKVLVLVRKTNSASLMKGIFLLLVILWVCSLLPLTVTNFLLGGAFELGLLALVILFQPELRRVLEQVGSGSFKDIIGKPAAKAKSIESAIAQTVLACTDLSKTKTGALLVFERNINLDAYIKTGTIVDASPAAELLKNLFYNKAPLHDGAVIVRDGRVAGAACMLPLSGNNSISRDLGMRHRAGIGISERSDAVVTIVSEETGGISVAIDGMLKRGLTPETLEKLLTRELMPKEPEKTGVLQKIKSARADKKHSGDDL